MPNNTLQVSEYRDPLADPHRRLRYSAYLNVCKCEHALKTARGKAGESYVMAERMRASIERLTARHVKALEQYSAICERAVQS